MVAIVLGLTLGPNKARKVSRRYDAEAEDREDQREEPAANVRALAKDALVVAGALVVVAGRCRDM